MENLTDQHTSNSELHQQQILPIVPEMEILTFHIYYHEESIRNSEKLSIKFRLDVSQQSTDLPSCGELLVSLEMTYFQLPFLELHKEVYRKACLSYNI